MRPTARSTPGGFCYHALNRGNRRAEVFHAEADYDRFVRLLAQAVAAFPVRLLAFCLMPNHFHLAVWPPGDRDLSACMHWLLTTHASRYQKQHRSTGHVWQGRFRAFPIQEDAHLLTVLRYIERNPLRAGLVSRAGDWRWSSLRWHLNPPQLAFLHAGPVPRPPDWAAWVNAPQTEAELRALRRCAQRARRTGRMPGSGKRRRGWVWNTPCGRAVGPPDLGPCAIPRRRRGRCSIKRRTWQNNKLCP
ncbi:MAG TPA: transposase [Gemmataceae bacterium]|nr:transposase [Gemmataceae bacterium]